MSTVIRAKPYGIDAPLTDAKAEDIDANFNVLFVDLLALSADLPSTTTIDGAYLYRVGGTDVALADGGTGASLTASAGALVYSTASALALSAVGASGQLARSTGTTAPGWTTPTYPNSATALKILVGDGTNIVLSTPTFSQTPTSGTYLRGDGTNWITSTLVLPNAAAAGDILKATGADTYGSTAPGALTKVDDTNVTLTLGGAPTTALVTAASITAGWTGTLGVARGGTGASLAATGGTSQVLQQASAGAAITVGTLASTNLSDTADLARLSVANAFTDTTDASSSTTGALKTAGGVGIAKKLYVGTNLAVGGTFSVSGFGTHSLNASGTGGNVLVVGNPTAGTGNYAQIAATEVDGYGLNLYAYSSTFTPTTFKLAHGTALYADGVGGLSIVADNSSGTLRFYTCGTDDSASYIKIGSRFVWIVGGINANFGTLNGTGNNAGNGLYVGRNRSGNGAAGYVGYAKRGGSLKFVWADASDNLRIGDDIPTEDNTTVSDTSGTVVGTQTSLRSTKNIYGAFTDYDDALRAMLSAPLWDFDYKSGAYNHQRFVGITTDDSPIFGMDEGRSFNPVTAFGYTVAAFKALARRVVVLESQALVNIE